MRPICNIECVAFSLHFRCILAGGLSGGNCYQQLAGVEKAKFIADRELSSTVFGTGRLCRDSAWLNRRRLIGPTAVSSTQAFRPLTTLRRLRAQPIWPASDFSSAR